MAEDVSINIGVNPSGAESGSRRAKSAIGGVAEVSKDLQKAFRAIKSAIDPTFAAQEKYNKAIADAKALMKADLLTRKEYNAAVRLAKKELEDHTAAVLANSAAGQKAAAQAKREAAEKAQAEKLAQEETVRAARLATQQKVEAARQERREKEKLEAQERQAIRLAAQLAREAARDARTSAATRTVGKVDAGSITTNKSIKQLEYDIKRLTTAAENAAARATAKAQAAAEASSAASARAAQAAAEKESAAAEQYAARATEARRTLTSVTKAAAAEEAAAEKAARDQARQAAQDAAAAATAAAKQKKAADAEATRAAREAAEAIKEQAAAERRSAAALTELRASIDPAFASQTRYNETMRRATQLLMENKLQQGEWITIQRQAKSQMDVNTRSLGRMNAMSVQVGYQMQDVVASWASGINPLVILAQQGGQTASALSGLGGTAGRVAAFFAGPWGAAIIGATLLLGYLWQSHDEGKKKTIDLMNAEERRKATLDQLNEAIDAYIKKQKMANEVTSEAKRIEAGQAQQNVNEVAKKLSDAQKELKQAEKDLNDLIKTPTADEGAAGMLLAARMRVKDLRNEVSALTKTFNDANQANVEASATYIQQIATMSAAERKEDKEKTEALRVFRAAMTAAGNDDKKQYAARVTYQRALNDINQRYIAIKAQEAAARRDNANAAKSEQAAFMMPVNGRISSGFGARNAPLKPDGTRGSSNHMGLDIAVPVGTPVKAPAVGTVTAIGYSATEGKYVILDHGGGTTSRYLHLSDNSMVQKGQTVQQGQVFAKSGNTGGVAPHLHYGVYINGKPVDPSKGVFPVDALKAEASGFKDLENAAHKYADTAVEAVDSAEAEVLASYKMTNQQKLDWVKTLEAARVKAIEEGYGKQSKEAEKAKQHELEAIRKANQAILQDEKNRLRQEEQIATIREQANSDAAKAKLGVKSDTVDFLEQSGMLSERQAVQMKAQLLDEDYQNQMNHEEAVYQLKMSYLEKELLLPNQSVDEIQRINDQIEQNQAEHYSRLSQMQMEYARNVAQSNQQAALLSMNSWRQMTSAFTSTLSSTFQGLWTRSTTVAQGLLNIADQMVYKTVDLALQAAERQFLIWVGLKQKKQVLDNAEIAQEKIQQATKLATKMAGATRETAIVAGQAATEQGIQTATTTAAVAGQAIKTGAAVQGAATQTSVSAAAGTAEITNQAAQSAAGAYKSTVVIPFIGPVAAPAAAALALAAVLGFGSLISARGGAAEIGSDGQLAELHKKEMVLPAWVAEPMRQSLKTRSGTTSLFGATAAAGSAAREAAGSSSEVNFNYQPQHNNQNADLATLLRQDGMTLRKWLKNEARNGNLRLHKA